VPVNRIVAFVQLIPLDQVDTAAFRRNGSRLGDEYTRMHGTPYYMRRRFMTSEGGVPCAPPPWGALVAVNLRTGARAWEVPLGDPSAIKPETGALSKSPLGTPNLGGPIITAGGVVFIGATMDKLIRAFDIETGKELWRGTLPGGARATPMTFQRTPSGKQFVVISVGGSDEWGKGDSVVAFALP
jgi:quinoprotein glucose dehydrogenase